MSATDLEILRQMWDEMGGPAPDEVRQDQTERWWHPEIEYREDPRWPGATTYRGRDQVVAAWNGYLEIFGEVKMQPEKILDAGDQLVALIRVTGVSKSADVPVDHTWAYVCRIRDGQLAYQRAYWDPQEALEAAGVS